MLFVKLTALTLKKYNLKRHTHHLGFDLNYDVHSILKSEERVEALQETGNRYLDTEHRRLTNEEN